MRIKHLSFLLIALCTGLAVNGQTRFFVQAAAGASTLGGYDADYLYDNPKAGFLSVRYLPGTTYSLHGGVEIQPDKRSPHLYKLGLGINSVSFRMKFKVADTTKRFFERSKILWDNTEISGYTAINLFAHYYYKASKKLYVGGGLSYDLSMTKFWLGEIGERYWDNDRYTQLRYKSLVSLNGAALYRLGHSRPMQFQLTHYSSPTISNRSTLRRCRLAMGMCFSV